MLDEGEMNRAKGHVYKVRAERVIAKLNKKNIAASLVLNRQEALKSILEIIPEGKTIGRGDSETIDQIGVFPELRTRGKNKIIDPYVKGPDGFLLERPERRKVMREALHADIFLTGTNAITLDGKLVNVDGFGNRISGMVFGPEKVIIVASANKIVSDVEEALSRIRNFCAPTNALRHYFKHNIAEYADLPCVKLGYCTDCNHEYRIDHYTLIIDGSMPFNKGRINVVIVIEELGI